MNYLTKELRKEEIKEWNKHKEDLKSELQTKRVYQEAAEQGIIDRAIELMESASDSDPLFTCMVLSVFKVSCSSLPTGLPFAGCYSAERAEKGAIKRVGVFTRKDFERLKGLDPVFRDPGKVFDQFYDSLEELEISRKLNLILSEEQKEMVLRALWQDAQLVAAATAATDVDNVASLEPPVSKVENMHERDKSSLLPGHVDIAIVQKALEENRIYFDPEELRKLADPAGSIRIRALLEPQKHPTWENKKIVKITWGKNERTIGEES